LAFQNSLGVFSVGRDYSNNMSDEQWQLVREVLPVRFYLTCAIGQFCRSFSRAALLMTLSLRRGPKQQRLLNAESDSTTVI
jgi:hypothetical protein